MDVKRARKVAFHCCFCGEKLNHRNPRSELLCPRCQAVFALKRNRKGCVVKLDIRTCGAVPCCQR